MLTSDVIKYFGDRAEVAKALGIKAPSVYGWGEIVPPIRQLQIQRITNGKLKADPSILDVPNGNDHEDATA